MFNIKYIKVDPTTYLLKYSKGRLKRKGNGLATWYYSPTTSLVAVPSATRDIPFIFKELTKDYQEVTIQGQLVYRIADPEKIAQLMNFTLKSDSSSQRLVYQSEDPEKLQSRILNLAQVKLGAELEQLHLREAISAAQTLVKNVLNRLQASQVLKNLGVEIADLSILAIKPHPETARALESAVREKLLEEADLAVYSRRNTAIEQERIVKENELETTLAVENKQREIKEEKLKAERAFEDQRRQLKREKLEADIAHEEKRQTLVDLATENERKQADTKAYEIAATMEALSKVDAQVLEAMTMGNLKPEQLLAQGLRELAGGAEKIGQLNIAPDLLQSIAGKIE